LPLTRRWQSAKVIGKLSTWRRSSTRWVPEVQAEAIARQFKRRYEAGCLELVTRAYLDLALERQSTELKADLARIERDLILKLSGAITLAVAVVGALGVLF
jgi:hypothetical protein